MSSQESEKSFIERVGALIPGIPGYRDRASRGGTDAQIRDYLASRLDGLREKFGEIRAVADEEGDLDMIEDLDRIGERITRTAEALRTAEYGGCAFFREAEVGEEALERIYAYDAAMLEDLELLSGDIEALKYETIGNLTLREVEGTLASIELRIANRRDLFEMAGE